MRTKRVLAAAGVSAALAAGGLAGLVLGVPDVSGAQTTDPPTTEAPEAPEAPSERGDHHCDDEGRGGGTGTSALAFRRL